MDAKLSSLPSSKRFTFLRQQNTTTTTNPPPVPKPEPKSIPKTSPMSPSNLPTKKRKFISINDENLPPSPNNLTPPTPYCLPAEKRVWAMKPEISPTKLASLLPAKKRVWAMKPEISPTKPTSLLPAKKRVWAMKPEISPTKPAPLLPAKKRIWVISPTKPDSLLPAKKRVWASNHEISPTKPASLLPAKKRVWAVKPEISPAKSPLSPEISRARSPYCLPAKKRIRTFKPEISPTKSPLSKLDLNVEYTPSPGKKVDLIGPGVVDNEEEFEDEDEDGILCAVCESTDGDPSDPIVFCDGCDLMVHASCYGNPLIKVIPEGDWYCAQCSNSRPLANTEPERVQCCLCPVPGGAMKPTNDGRWAHIVCAVLVPEVFFEDPEGRDGVDCSKVPKKRWREGCYLCKKRRGCAIECSQMKCPLSFHVTCGLKDDLCIELKEGRSSSGGGIVAAFCRKHTDLWKKQQQTGKYKIVARDEYK